MILRHLSVLLQRRAQGGGAVLLQGPRGAGKTTLACREFAGRLYVDLSDPAVRVQAAEDPGAFLAKLRRPAVVDEAARCGALVEYLRAHPVQAPVVFVSDLRLDLAMPTLELHPPTRAERERRPAMELELLGRFAPERREGRRDWAAGFGGGREYLWRDVPLLVGVHDLDRFERFALLVERASGELLRQQEMARELGVAHRTVARWLEVLDACFLTVRARPWERDLGRRQVKRAKLYWLGGAGNLETEVVTELYRNGRHAGLAPRFWHWRDSNGLEVPLLVETEAGAVPCAVSETPGPLEEARLRRWMGLAGMPVGAVIGRTPAGVGRRGAGIVRYGVGDF